MSKVETFQRRFHYSFKNANLLEEAFIAAGAPVSRKDLSGPTCGNKRLALLGDAVLSLSVLDTWYPTGKSQKNGHNTLQEVATNEKLKNVAKNVNLTDWLEENPCQAGQEPRETLAATVEALIGAVWLDCGRNLLEVQKFIKELQGR